MNVIDDHLFGKELDNSKQGEQAAGRGQTPDEDVHARSGGYSVMSYQQDT
jgi:hypothetical protein